MTFEYFRNASGNQPSAVQFGKSGLSDSGGGDHQGLKPDMSNRQPHHSTVPLTQGIYGNIQEGSLSGDHLIQVRVILE